VLNDIGRKAEFHLPGNQADGMSEKVYDTRNTFCSLSAHILLISVPFPLPLSFFPYFHGTLRKHRIPSL
jgi:hypothetical protein